MRAWDRSLFHPHDMSEGFTIAWLIDRGGDHPAIPGERQLSTPVNQARLNPVQFRILAVDRDGADRVTKPRLTSCRP